MALCGGGGGLLVGTMILDDDVLVHVVVTLRTYVCLCLSLPPVVVVCDFAAAAPLCAHTLHGLLPPHVILTVLVWMWDAGCRWMLLMTILCLC